jgi:NitT/TauT family transport system ATP-binding protein
MSSNTMIELKNVTHTYVTKSEAITAIQGISLSISKGEFISIVGPSGCGKSTILSSIAGLIRPTLGEVIIDGKQVLNPSPKVGYMLQSDYLFEWKTILQNVLVGLEVMGNATNERIMHANYLLNELGLSAYKEHYPSQLSGGMRQRAALVRTLVTNPDILLLDEPFSALDYQTKLKLEDLVFDTLKKHEKTAILVTHDIGEAIAMSDRIIILKRDPGEVKEDLPVPDSIRETMPFHAREVKEYHHLFHHIWKELDEYVPQS